MDFKLKRIGTKDVEVKNLYVGGDGFLRSGEDEKTYKFTKLKDYKYQGHIKEILEHPEKDIKEYLYYKNKQGGMYWYKNRTFTKQECLECTEKMIDLIKSIQENGFDISTSRKFKMNDLGLPDGPVTGLVVGDKTLIIDGYHRSSIALALGIKTIPIILFKQKI